ncbi:MAG: hypothetical protein HFG42_17985 [Lachnospiraceae bacterium]|nr:hypothetical protein [Lachnospiraceae bacterium]
MNLPGEEIKNPVGVYKYIIYSRLDQERIPFYENRAEYTRGLSPEQVYTDMLYKIVEAPTRIHMRVSARMLLPIIVQKLPSVETEG